MSYVYITATKNQCLTTVIIESSVEENPVLPVTQWSEVNKGPLVTLFLVVDGVRGGFHDVGGQDLLPAGSPAAVEHADQCVQGRGGHGQRR